MKWFLMLLIFIGGVYYLVNKREADMREEARKKAIAEETQKGLQGLSLPDKTEREYAMKFSQQTITTLRSLVSDANDKVRFASVELLWQLQDEQAPAIIKRMFHEEAESEVKQMLIDMLGKDKSRLSLSLLAEALGDYDKETRLKAVQTISSFSSQETIPVLTRVIQDYDDDIRLKSIQAINQIRQDIETNKAQEVKETAKQPLFQVE